MGSSESEIEEAMRRFHVERKELFAPEIPRHRVQIAPFVMDRHPVTNADFRLFLEEYPAWSSEGIPDLLHNGNYLAHWNDSGFPEGLADVPVVNVSWYAAEAYCRWRKGHLPTEEQWEWAARGGLRDPEFPWGDGDPGNGLANWAGDPINTAVPVGRYPSNGYGLYDMAGNVWQYCLDEWHDDSYSTGYDPSHLMAAGFDFTEIRTRRVIRGGSWGAAAVNMRVTFRDSHPPEGAGAHVGFRCVRPQ